MSDIAVEPREIAIASISCLLTPLASLKEPYCVFGSAALSLLGVNVGPIGDIDILTTPAGVQNLADSMDAPIARREPSDRFRSSSFSTIATQAVPIELMSNLEVRHGDAWLSVWPSKVVPVRVGSHGIMVASLTDQMRFLKLFGRTKDKNRLAAIEKHLTAL
ncbi:MAG: hypothetical protein AAF141_04160 [Pseudomonadota bacterium]